MTARKKPTAPIVHRDLKPSDVVLPIAAPRIPCGGPEVYERLPGACKCCGLRQFDGNRCMQCGYVETR